MRVLSFILTVLVLASCSRKNFYDHNQDLLLGLLSFNGMELAQTIIMKKT